MLPLAARPSTASSRSASRAMTFSSGRWLSTPTSPAACRPRRAGGMRALGRRRRRERRIESPRRSRCWRMRGRRYRSVRERRRGNQDGMRWDRMGCDAMGSDGMRCDGMRWDAMRCDAMRCDAMRCDAMRCDAMCFHSALHFLFFALSSGAQRVGSVASRAASSVASSAREVSMDDFRTKSRELAEKTKQVLTAARTMTMIDD